METMAQDTDQNGQKSFEMYRLKENERLQFGKSAE
jgi:hypothetical protein